MFRNLLFLQGWEGCRKITLTFMIKQKKGKNVNRFSLRVYSWQFMRAENEEKEFKDEFSDRKRKNTY